MYLIDFEGTILPSTCYRRSKFFSIRAHWSSQKKKKEKKKKKKKERKKLIDKEFGPYEINISGGRVYYFVALIQYICGGGGGYLSRGER